MYSKSVFDADVDIPWFIHDGSLRVPPLGRSGLVQPSKGWVRIGGELVYEGQDEDSGVLAEAVNRWYRRVATALGLLGAVFGLALSQLARKRGPFATRGDCRLWMLLALVVFSLVAWAGIPGENESLVDATRVRFYFAKDLYRSEIVEELQSVPRDAIREGIVAITVAWAGHAVLVRWGLRPSHRRIPDQAADYDDRTSPAPRAP
jgi:hypothetical protein